MSFLFFFALCIAADLSLLAARISVSNLHKNTPDTFSKTIEKLHNYVLPQTGERSSLISEDVYNIVMEVMNEMVDCRYEVEGVDAIIIPHGHATTYEMQ